MIEFNALWANLFTIDSYKLQKLIGHKWNPFPDIRKKKFRKKYFSVSRECNSEDRYQS